MNTLLITFQLMMYFISILFHTRVETVRVNGVSISLKSNCSSRHCLSKSNDGNRVEVILTFLISNYVRTLNALRILSKKYDVFLNLVPKRYSLGEMPDK